jgi:uncharacterized protein (UPF0332 family)
MPEEKKTWENMVQQVMDLWITPEVMRRQEQGLIPKPFNLWQAQVIFFADGRPHQIRLNDEVKVVHKAKLKKDVSKKAGELIYYHEVENFDMTELPKTEDPNCGHITIYGVNGMWHASFDLRYNKELSGKHTQAAKEFLSAAEFSKEKQHWRSFVDNLFSAAELSTKAVLLTSPDKDFAKKASHGVIHSRYNSFARHGNADPKHREVFNKLAELRSSARYVKKDFSLSEAEVEKFLQAVTEMVEIAEKGIAARKFLRE